MGENFIDFLTSGFFTNIIFYYDVVCFFAFLASTQVQALADRVGATIEWHPVLLGGIFRAIGSDQVPARTRNAARVSVGSRDLQRQAQQCGVPLAFPSEHPRRTVEAMRLIAMADLEERGRRALQKDAGLWKRMVEATDGADVATQTDDFGRERPEHPTIVSKLYTYGQTGADICRAGHSAAWSSTLKIDEGRPRNARAGPGPAATTTKGSRIETFSISRGTEGGEPF